MGVGLGGKIPKPKGLNMDFSSQTIRSLKGSHPLKFQSLWRCWPTGEGQRSKTELFVRGTRENFASLVRLGVGNMAPRWGPYSSPVISRGPIKTPQ